MEVLEEELEVEQEEVVVVDVATEEVIEVVEVAPLMELNKK